MGMTELAAASSDTASGLAAAAGGIYVLQSNPDTYFQHFVSAEEREKNLREAIARRLEEVGLATPAS